MLARQRPKALAHPHLVPVGTDNAVLGEVGGLQGAVPSGALPLEVACGHAAEFYLETAPHDQRRFWLQVVQLPQPGDVHPQPTRQLPQTLGAQYRDGLVICDRVVRRVRAGSCLHARYQPWPRLFRRRFGQRFRGCLGNRFDSCRVGRHGLANRRLDGSHGFHQLIGVAGYRLARLRRRLFCFSCSHYQRRNGVRLLGQTSEKDIAGGWHIDHMRTLRARAGSEAWQAQDHAALHLA